MLLGQSLQEGLREPGNGTTLTEADAQDAGGSYFEHILR